jgi:hypothetical protein
MDHYIVLLGIIILLILIKISWAEYIMMSKNPTRYRKKFLDPKIRREIVYEVLHKIYTDPFFASNNRKDTIKKIKTVVTGYLKDSEDENAVNRKNKGR